MNSTIDNIFQHLQSAPFAALFLDALLKSFVVLALAGAVCVLWRRASAATRHRIWFLAVASLLCLPLLNSPVSQKPVWTISTAAGHGNQVSLAVELAPKSMAPSAANPQIPPRISADTSGAAGSRKIAAQFNAHWMLFGWLAWLSGVMAVLARILAGQFGRRQFSRSAKPLQDPDWSRLLGEARETLRLNRPVTLLHSPENVMPMTWGWLRPVILLPSAAAQWPGERRRAVLLHELAHIQRRDYLTQIVAQLVCALYWFNPLVWVAARQMAVEREGACDDLVLSGGCKASEYAGHLVDIAGSFRRVPQMAAIGMARSSHLAGRIAAIVDGSRNRRLRSAAALAILALIGGIAVGLGGTGIYGASGADQADALRQKQIAQLEAFSQQKEKQSEALAAATGETISPAFQKFFEAAIAGDWQTVTNLYEGFKQRHPQYSHPGGQADESLRTSFWGPVLEICLAYDHVARCEPVYTQMAVDDIINSIPAGSIYFGGTDPGRGLPTAFSKSHVDADPFYTLTQNALADGTYLDYLRRTYGDQKELLPQMAAACRADQGLQQSLPDETDKLQAEAAATQLEIAAAQKDGDSERRAATLSELERKAKIQRDNLVFFSSDLAESRTKRVTEIVARLQQNPHPVDSQALYIPTVEDSQRSFAEYTSDAQQRLQNHSLKPGEDVKVADGHTEVSGQVAVMQINGLLAKTIIDKNPGHEFFIEESFPLDWMYPHLEPHGLILKINLLPLPEISDALVRQDREYWQPRVNQMIGDWLNDTTPVAAVTAFGEKVFSQHDLAGFTGDPRFVQNDYASRLFSKLRLSIAGLYAWRAEHDGAVADQARMATAADLAFRQSIALCPYSPEATYRYAEFLYQQQRGADAKLVQVMAEQFKSTGSKATAPIFQIRLALDVPMDNTEPMQLVTRKASPSPGETLYVTKNVLLDNTAVQAAVVSKSPQGYQEIGVTFTESGRKQFAELTRLHLHQRLAIVIDGKLWMAPTVQAEISEGKATVTGNFSETEAQALAAKINESVGK